MIHCAIKAHPKPKIRWYKNKMEITDYSKYRMTAPQGIVQLEVRRSKLGDSGVYKVVAENALGKDELSADIKVKEAVERTENVKVKV